MVSEVFDKSDETPITSSMSNLFDNDKSSICVDNLLYTMVKKRENTKSTSSFYLLPEHDLV